ncbi:MAG TPA: hypothetical protein VJQ56_16535, partial [Blastocatellia bacterium]|nr:hypothetical protein [Blastocatellia bacterium]
MATEQEARPASDRMVFYDNYETPLHGGSYRFVLQQTIKVEGEDARHYYREQPFEVLAPRYTIDGGEIQAYFPPPGGVAEYKNTLPHLVLRTRSLPWERTVWPDNKREPWLALLVLSAQEISEGRVEAKTGKVEDLSPESTEGRSWSRSEDGVSILVPKFTRKEDPQTPVRLIDLDLKLFLKICPRRGELPLLAHIRQVDTTDKVPLEMVADGEFSVLVANRFPPPGATTVYLVSLEGWGELIEEADAPNQFTRLRLITLASWSFVNDSAGHDTFSGLVQRLRTNAAVFAVEVSTKNDSANRALASGYVPVDYQPLDSTPTLAWYRGPLSPVTRPSLGQPLFRRSDAALIFDEPTAVLDVSYAAAWQLGRLLALASPAFSKALRLFVERRLNAKEFKRQIDSFLKLHRDKTPDDSQSDVEQVAIAEELVEWIARLVLLYPVPFRYLVPHPALLPPESLRFFHLDDNWIDALVDGALSIAVRNIADQGVVSRADLQEVLSRAVYQHRLRLLGKRAEGSPSTGYNAMPKSGFLLRSSVVTGWPGVEVTATTTGPIANFPEILRMDQIADGVMFCLAGGLIKRVTFREPREGLTFGVPSEGAV